MKALLIALASMAIAPIFASTGCHGKPLVVILLGPPGAGKGVQAQFITQDLVIPHISTGNILRENVKNQTELGQEAKKYMDAGQLVPDGVVLSMLFERIARADAQNGYLLDGFPRTVLQAKEFQQHVGSSVDIVVIDLEVSDEVILDRLAGRAKIEGRCDDTPEVVKERLRVYHSQTAPLIDYFKAQGILMMINGQRGVEEVRADIKEALTKCPV